ncbi:MAG: hypothetical protein ACKVQS_11430, partial [Fimbriimonadaceae bacterium]
MRTKMTHIKILTIAAILTMNSSAIGQIGSGGGTPEDPVVRQKQENARHLEAEAKTFFDKSEWSACVAKLNEALLIYEDINKPPGTFVYWRLARAYRFLGEIPKASFAYKEMTRLLPNGELSADNADETLLDYIEFLAQTGREEDAKIVYYSFMRKATRMSDSKSDMNFEPFPILIVFDQDTMGDYWDYTPSRIVLAAKLMVRNKNHESHTLETGEVIDLAQQLLDEAKLLFPGWYLPYAYESMEL